jgi:hypothetical protein
MEIWIDALYVDQDDMAEWNDQGGCIGVVYDSAV